MDELRADPKIWEGYKNNLKGRVFKLLPLREEGAEWEKFLDSILHELYGIDPEKQTINFLRICFKLNFLRNSNMDAYKKTIFECLGLIDKLEL